jgi:hypothetical protein
VELPLSLELEVKQRARSEKPLAQLLAQVEVLVAVLLVQRAEPVK